MVETGSDIRSSAYLDKMPLVGHLSEMVRRIEASDEPAAVASAVEFVLEGLHLNRRLNRDQVGGSFVYRG